MRRSHLGPSTPVTCSHRELFDPTLRLILLAHAGMPGAGPNNGIGRPDLTVTSGSANDIWEVKSAVGIDLDNPAQDLINAASGRASVQLDSYLGTCYASETCQAGGA
jgi:hypothetical protein